MNNLSVAVSFKVYLNNLLKKQYNHAVETVITARANYLHWFEISAILILY